MRFDETQLAIRDNFRRFMTKNLEPVTYALESGALLPYPLMKRMIDELGLAAAPPLFERSGAAGAGDTLPRDPAAAALAGFARTQFMVEICRVNPGFALSFGASLGLFGDNVRKRGTAEQVARYVPPVMRGDKIGCWCLTEPEAGSDALGAMRTVARRDGDDYVLSGSKTFITNAPHADFFLVY